MGQVRAASKRRFGYPHDDEDGAGAAGEAEAINMLAGTETMAEELERQTTIVIVMAKMAARLARSPYALL